MTTLIPEHPVAVNTATCKFLQLPPAERSVMTYASLSRSPIPGA
jgi:hypothetical protein